MAVFGFWLLLSVAVGVLASNRGRSGFGWFVLSLAVSPLLGLIFCLVVKDLAVVPGAVGASAATHCKCPACAEFVLPEATVCKHCGAEVKPDNSFWLRQVQAEKLAIRDQNRKIGFCFFVVAIAAGIFWAK